MKFTEPRLDLTRLDRLVIGEDVGEQQSRRGTLAPGVVRVGDQANEQQARERVTEAEGLVLPKLRLD